jgi:general secretion pathway protein A
MYEQFYGFRERPFTLTPNPRYLLLTPAHAEALNTVKYAISSRASITVLLGKAGTGKTTVIRAALASQPPGVRVLTVTNPLLTKAEFLEHLALGFELSAAVSASKTRFLLELTRLLEGEVRARRHTALIVDEAHALPDEILEEIRLLANLETDDEKMLPIILAGQAELGDRFNEPRFWQLKQRVALRCSLGPLLLQETAAMIAGRISVAGVDAATVFTRDAVELIHNAARGLPRTINVICDNALVAGFAADERPVRRETVRDVCRDLDLSASSRTNGQGQRAERPVRPDVDLPDARHTRASGSEPPETASLGARLGSFLRLLA